jgi:hypothetical protein
MKARHILPLLYLLVQPLFLRSQDDDWTRIGLEDAVSNDTIVVEPFTLVFINKQPGFSENTRSRMIETFFKVYPQQVALYNSKAPSRVVFVIDPAYKGVAAASSGIIRYSPEWFAKNPEDLDVVTHESMHLVQSYKNFEPGWVTEGIADYVRYKMGVNNAAAGWKLPDLKPGHNYDNAYRITARFFVWLEKYKKADLVAKLNRAMTRGKYKDSFWRKQTGQELPELWKEYTDNPAI